MSWRLAPIWHQGICGHRDEYWWPSPVCVYQESSSVMFFPALFPVSIGAALSHEWSLKLHPLASLEWSSTVLLGCRLTRHTGWAAVFTVMSAAGGVKNFTLGMLQVPLYFLRSPLAILKYIIWSKIMTHGVTSSQGDFVENVFFCSLHCVCWWPSTCRWHLQTRQWPSLGSIHWLAVSEH